MRRGSDPSRPAYPPPLSDVTSPPFFCYARWTRTLAPWAGGAVSGLVHVLAIGGLAWWAASQPDDPARFAGSRSVTSIAMAGRPPEAAPVTPITITPAEALVLEEALNDRLTIAIDVDLKKVLPELTIDRVLEEPEFATVHRPRVPETARQDREEGAPPPASAKAAARERTMRHKPPETSVTVRTSDLPPAPSAASRTASVLGTDPLLPPTFTGNSQPRYPEQARQYGWQGMVLLRIKVGLDGRISRVEIVQSSGFEVLDDEAVRTVQSWRGSPATRRGQPVETVEILPVRFRLRG